MSLQTRPLSDAFGTEVQGLDLTRPLGSDEAAAVYRAWQSSGLLLFRGQELSAEDLVRVGALFGTVEKVRAPDEGPAGSARIRHVANCPVAGKAGILPRGAMQLHTDWCYRETPYKAGLLHALEVPDAGGETVFASTEKAYAALPAETKARIADLTAVQAYQNQETERPDVFHPEAQRAEHPVVIAHPETGRRSLFVNRLMTERIVGPAPDEAAALLQVLLDHIERPDFGYRHGWRKGDLMVWDNLTTQHGRRDFDPAVPRILRRITIRGGRPMAASAKG